MVCGLQYFISLAADSELSESVLSFLQRDPVRYQTLCQLGRLVRYIISESNHSMGVSPKQIAVVIPVDDLSYEEREADNNNKTHMSAWNEVFGQILILIEEPEVRA
jgi:hypothetical protein